jgi:hypothetical protein
MKNNHSSSFISFVWKPTIGNPINSVEQIIGKFKNDFLSLFQTFSKSDKTTSKTIKLKNMELRFKKKA